MSCAWQIRTCTPQEVEEEQEEKRGETDIQTNRQRDKIDGEQSGRGKRIGSVDKWITSWTSANVCSVLWLSLAAILPAFLCSFWIYQGSAKDDLLRLGRLGQAQWYILIDRKRHKVVRPPALCLVFLFYFYFGPVVLHPRTVGMKEPEDSHVVNGFHMAEGTSHQMAEGSDCSDWLKDASWFCMAEKTNWL